MNVNPGAKETPGVNTMRQRRKGHKGQSDALIYGCITNAQGNGPWAEQFNRWVLWAYRGREDVPQPIRCNQQYVVLCLAFNAPDLR